MTNTPTDVQIIRGSDGNPAFAVIPYEEFERLTSVPRKAYIPHVVVGKMSEGERVARAWREHLGFTQAEVSTRMGITQAAYSQLESSKKLRASSRRRLAEALGLETEQLV